MPGAEAGDPGGEGAVHVSVPGLGVGTLGMWRWGGWGDPRTKGNKKHKVDVITWELDLSLALESPGSCFIAKTRFARLPLLTGCESPQLSYQPPQLSLQGSC